VSTEEHNLVLILARGLASSIATPMLVVDPAGTLVYFNEPAEGILGLTFAESGKLPAEEWRTTFYPEDSESGEKIDLHELPLSTALSERRPAHQAFAITGRDDVRREIAVTAFPLFARTDELVGAVAIFWERDGR
jgi:PAS domain-containing protein